MPQPGFVVLMLAYLAFISLGLPDTVIGVAWPSLREAFGISPSALGAVLAAGMSGYFLSGLWAGWVVARLAVGGVLALSSALVAVALFGFSLAPTWTVFFPFGALMGLGSGAIDSGLNAYAARHFSMRHVNWLHACWGMGASIGPALMTFCVARGYGYRAGYALVGAVLAGMTLLFAITRGHWEDWQPAAAEPGAVPARETAASSDAGAQQETPPTCAKSESVRAALRNGSVWLQVLVFFLYTGVEASVGQWCFSWLRDQRGLQIAAAGAWTSAYWASLTVGRVVLASIIDRVGPDRMLRAATVGAVIGVTLFASAPSPLDCLGLLLLGASLAPVYPTLMARTPARVGDGLAHHAVGFQVSAATLGATLLPSFVAFFVARYGLGAIGPVIVSVVLALLLSHELLLGRSRRTTAAAA